MSQVPEFRIELADHIEEAGLELILRLDQVLRQLDDFVKPKKFLRLNVEHR